MSQTKYKHLSESDVKMLKELFVLPQKNGKLDKYQQEQELAQIDDFYSHMEVTIDNKKSTMKKAREILGQEQFLSGLDRAVFHYSSSREGANGESVSFDSSKYWSKIHSQERTR